MLAPFSLPRRFLGRYDMIVCGADLPALAAALAAAQSGRRVVVLERSIAPAGDVCANLRLEVTADDRDRLCALWGIATNEVTVTSGEGHFWHPARLKVALEDRLLSDGVELIYGVSPFAWRTRDVAVDLLAGCKSGCLEIRGEQIVLASQETGLLATINPLTAFRARLPRVRRIEFAGARPHLLTSGTFSGPDGLPVTWCHGPAGLGHIFVDIPVRDEPSHMASPITCGFPDPAETAYRSGMDLIEGHPAFQHARLAGIASRSLHPESVHLAGGANAAHGAAALPSGFWAVGANAASDPEQWHRLASDLVEAVQEGSAVGRNAARACPPEDGREGCLPIHSLDTDVLVIGGGTTGANAGIAAGEHGVSVVVADANPGLGGTGTFGGINSYWFSRRVGHNTRLTRAVRNLQPADGYETTPHWQMKMWSVETKKNVLLEMARASRVRLLRECIALGALKEGNRTEGAWLVQREALVAVRSRVTIDATGDGDFAELAGVACAYGAARSGATMWFTLASQTRPGTYRSNFTSSVDVRDVRDYTRAVLSGRRRGAPTGANASTGTPYDHASYLGTRESRHIRGEVTLQLVDQLRLRQWPDTVTIAFSNHDIKGYTESDWVRIGLIPPNLEIEIPYRTLVPLGVDGLLVTGKAVSATSEALPAIRMQGDFENLGYATGTAAALAVRQGVEPRNVSIPDLQARMVAAGILPPAISGRVQPSSAEDTPFAALLLEALSDDQPLYRYQDMEMGEVHRERLPFVELCCQEAACVVPLLLKEISKPESPRRLMSALALAWFERPEAAPVLRAHIDRHLQSDRLPSRQHPIRYAHPPPDQGNMPELAYLLHAIALTRHPGNIELIDGLAARLDLSEGALFSPTAGVFDYVDAICDIAERLGDPRCEPVLARLAQVPLWQGRVFRGIFQADWYEERRAFLEILIARARARCGERAGYSTLIDYLEDSRRPLVNHALAELKRVTSLDFAPEATAWRAWLDATSMLPPCPWRGRTP